MPRCRSLGAMYFALMVRNFKILKFAFSYYRWTALFSFTLYYLIKPSQVSVAETTALDIPNIHSTLMKATQPDTEVHFQLPHRGRQWYIRGSWWAESFLESSSIIRAALWAPSLSFLPRMWMWWRELWGPTYKCEVTLRMGTKEEMMETKKEPGMPTILWNLCIIHGLPTPRLDFIWETNKALHLVRLPYPISELLRACGNS